MKIILLAFLLAFSVIEVPAQSKERIINLDSISRIPKTEAQLAEGATKTLSKAIYKGNKYPIYLSKNNKMFIIVQSPTSKNWYRKYIKDTQN